MNLFTGQRILLKWLMWIAGLVLIVLLVFDIDGWRAFLLDIIGSFLVQTIVAVFLFGVLAVGARIVQGFTGLHVSSPGALRIMFLVAAGAGLLLLSTMVHRQIDVYDLGQALVLVVAFESLLNPIQRLIRGIFRSSAPQRRFYAVRSLTPHTSIERNLYSQSVVASLG